MIKYDFYNKELSKKRNMFIYFYCLNHPEIEIVKPILVGDEWWYKQEQLVAEHIVKERWQSQNH